MSRLRSERAVALKSDRHNGFSGHGLNFLRSLLFQIFFWTFSVLINLAFLPALLLPRRVTVRGMEIWASVTVWGLKSIGGLD